MNGNDNIGINTSSLSQSLGEFQANMSKVQEIGEKIKELTSKLKTVWEGDVGDAATEEMNKFQEVFESISQQNQKYVNFLNVVIGHYTTADNKQGQTLDSNAEHFGVSE